MSLTDDFRSLQSENLPFNPYLGFTRSEDKTVIEAIEHDGHGQKPFHQHFGASEMSLNGLMSQRRPTALLSPMEVLGKDSNLGEDEET